MESHIDISYRLEMFREHSEMVYERHHTLESAEQSAYMHRLSVAPSEFYQIKIARIRSGCTAKDTLINTNNKPYRDVVKVYTPKE